jgi:hypothetical protein
MAVRAVLVFLVTVGALVSPACSSKEEEAPPVAKPTVSFSRSRAALGSPIEATFRFEVAQSADIGGDYRVLLHFIDADGELMWADDHDPPVPTSRWTPGQVIEYSKTLFIPIYPYVGNAVVHLGLYAVDDQSRLPLEAPTEGMREYQVATLELLPTSENILVLYKDGWHQIETADGDSTVEWQWAKKVATLSFRNPGKPVVFYLHADSPGSYAEPQTAEIRIGGEVVDTFEIQPRQEFIHRTRLTPEQLGSTDIVDLTLELDKAWVPALIPEASNRDPRELGLRVFHTYVEPAG